MLAMQRSYAALKNSSTDLDQCEGRTIKDFFDQMGLKAAWEFDDRVEKYSREEAKHESTSQKS